MDWGEGKGCGEREVKTSGKLNFLCGKQKEIMLKYFYMFAHNTGFFYE